MKPRANLPWRASDNRQVAEQTHWAGSPAQDADRSEYRPEGFLKCTTLIRAKLKKMAILSWYRFRTSPGALTQVDRDEDFNYVARDCLVAALGGYVERGQRPPRPSSSRGRPAVALDVFHSAKLALLTAMIEAGVTNVELARKLNVSEKVARRLRDLDHVSRIDRLEAALACMGQQLELAVRPISVSAARFTEVQA